MVRVELSPLPRPVPGNAKISTPTTHGLHTICEEVSADEVEPRRRSSVAFLGGRGSNMTPLIRGRGFCLPARAPYDEPTGMFWLVKLLIRYPTMTCPGSSYETPHPAHASTPPRGVRRLRAWVLTASAMFAGVVVAAVTGCASPGPSTSPAAASTAANST